VRGDVADPRVGRRCPRCPIGVAGNAGFFLPTRERVRGDADSLIKEEIQFLRVVMGHENESFDDFVKARDACQEDLMFFPARGTYGLASVAGNNEKLAALQNEFEIVKKRMDDEAKRATRLEQKIKILTHGYQQARAGKLWSQVEATFKQVDTAATELECFQVLQKQELLAATYRVNSLVEEVNKQKALEQSLQHRYGDLLAEHDRVKRLLEEHKMRLRMEEEIAARNRALEEEAAARNRALEEEAAARSRALEEEAAAKNRALEEAAAKNRALEEEFAARNPAPVEETAERNVTREETAANNHAMNEELADKKDHPDSDHAEDGTTSNQEPIQGEANHCQGIVSDVMDDLKEQMPVANSVIVSGDMPQLVTEEKMMVDVKITLNPVDDSMLPSVLVENTGVIPQADSGVLTSDVGASVGMEDATISDVSNTQPILSSENTNEASASDIGGHMTQDDDQQVGMELVDSCNLVADGSVSNTDGHVDDVNVNPSLVEHASGGLSSETVMISSEISVNPSVQISGSSMDHDAA
ncbi:hypothetical protein GW17_00038649, partial [Ensete ventricosum]